MLHSTVHTFTIFGATSLCPDGCLTTPTGTWDPYLEAVAVTHNVAVDNPAAVET